MNPNSAPTLVLRSDFPGGNVRIRSIDGFDVALSTDIRDTTQYWFYWCFRAEFPCAGTWRFSFDGPAVGTRGPAISRDGGDTWAWQSAALHESDREFEYTAAGPEAVEFSQCIPYRQRHLDAFLARHAANPLFGVSQLCVSRKGRPVELIRIREGNPAECVLFTCRHHAQESMAAYAVEGVLETFLEDTPMAREFRRHFEILTVPMVDKDGVWDGDQGKARAPHDHGRDYGPGGGLYPETSAISEILDTRRPVLVQDFHCPWLRGGETNEQAYLVGSDQPRMNGPMDRLGRLLEKHCPPEAPYFNSDTLPFGKYWNTNSNYRDGIGIKGWAGRLECMRCAQSLEIPFANFRELTQTPETIRAFGRGVAAAFNEFLLG